jgi:hypothetical protein
MHPILPAGERIAAWLQGSWQGSSPLHRVPHMFGQRRIRDSNTIANADVVYPVGAFFF